MKYTIICAFALYRTSDTLYHYIYKYHFVMSGYLKVQSYFAL